jgi:P-type Na+/K+ transporter
MGIEEQNNVEESTEPPICGQSQRDATPQPIWLDTGHRLRVAHTFPIENVEQLLETSASHGLSYAEAARRLAADGPNKVKAAKGLSVWKILLRQVSNSLTVVLILVMTLSFTIHDYAEGGVITAVIVLNIVVGLVARG